ncbi:IS1/IS1595 family N-terminal zinc-binding domain-containing protein [Skermanella aerolata]|uniref:IS1/IS1595 family N-terminal zinc-binding domain-containing protein n=1 Tax=Skermanella aerolata TaxID=393310 RepID=UPI003CE59F8C
MLKSGHARGKQRWLCRRCRYEFTRPDGYSAPDEVKQAAVTLYGFGLSLNAVGRLLRSGAQSVMRWVCAYGDRNSRSRRSSRCRSSRLTRCGTICSARRTGSGSEKPMTGRRTG